MKTMKFIKIDLHWQILIAFVAAVLFGVLLPDSVQYVAWMGILFIRLLNMIIIPLIISSIITGITNIGNAENLGRLGVKTIGYYLLTSMLAIFTGLFFVNIIRPGAGAQSLLLEKVMDYNENGGDIGDMLLKIVPNNFFKSLMEGDMLQIIFFSILFGFFTTRTSAKINTFLTSFFNSVFEVMMKITMFIIKFAPMGIFGIVSRVVAEQDNYGELVGTMGKYMLTVILALSFHAFINLFLLLKLVGKINPFKHFKAVSTALLTAFSTSSSSATLPLTISDVEEKSGVSNKISSFTLPLGATINMDGTALYELVAVLFIAQQYGLELSFGQQLIVVFTALLASIGAAGIPMAGLVMMTIILKAVDLPLEGIGLILAVDRILDMFRTSVNVWSDTCGAVIIGKSEGEILKV